MPNTGWKVSEIIQEANGRTENRAANKPNFNTNMEFFLGLDEFCMEKHFWWRRKAASFQTAVNQQTYDLSKSIAQGGANAPDAEEIEEAFIVNGTPLQHPKRVRPDFSPKRVIASLFGGAAIQAWIPHTGYFMAPGTFQQWDFDQAPTSVLTVAFTYWAIPMVSSGQVAQATSEPPPLVPPFLHWGLVTVMERRIYKYLLAQNDPRYQAAEADYQKFVATAAKSKQYSSQQAIHASSNIAVHSSGGRGYRPGWGR